jgi:hypothetical protein
MSMDYNIDENQSVFIKIDKTSPNQFLWFTENQLVTIQKIQILIFRKIKREKIEQ